MSTWRIAALFLTVTAGVCLLTAAVLCFGLYAVPTVSMEDTLVDGDRILVEKLDARLGREPQFGDIVLTHYPLNRSEIYIKRIEGIPGDRLRLVNKQLYRNGAPVTEPYARHSTTFVDPYRDNFPSTPESALPPAAVEMLSADVHDGELLVPPGKYFVMGDNRDDSSDSRYWGYIVKSDIVGRPICVYLSIDPETGKIRGERSFKRL